MQTIIGTIVSAIFVKKENEFVLGFICLSILNVFVCVVEKINRILHSKNLGNSIFLPQFTVNSSNIVAERWL